MCLGGNVKPSWQSWRPCKARWAIPRGVSALTSVPLARRRKFDFGKHSRKSLSQVWDSDPDFLPYLISGAPGMQARPGAGDGGGLDPGGGWMQESM